MALFWFALDIGKYNNKTQHLTMLEHGAYFALMRAYYANGQPLPSDPAQLQRICRAHSDEELKAVSVVISQFFKLRRGKFHQQTCDEEIAKASLISTKRRNAALTRHHANAQQVHIETECISTHNNNNSNKEEPKVKSMRSRFEPPALGEVTEYCQERGGHVDGQQWFNYYTANGWKVGRNAMRDWRASVRYWEKNGNGTSRQITKQSRSEQVLSNNKAAAAAVGWTAANAGAIPIQRADIFGDRALAGEVKRLPE